MHASSKTFQTRMTGFGMLCAFFAVGAAGAVSVSACSDDPAAESAPGGGDAGGAETTTTQDGGDTTDTGTTNDGASGSDATSADAEPPGPPSVRYIGRFDTRDPAGPRVNWAGARVLYRFAGTGLTVKLTEVDESDLPNGDPDTSRYDVIIDGNVQPLPLILDKGDKDYVVAKDLVPSTPHVVELYRRTETYVGMTQFKSFTIAGSGGALLAPPFAAPHHIEIIGDSASNGYGVECPNSLGSFTGATQNERKSYPALMAKAVNAEHHNLSFGGKGVSRNYDATDADMYTSIYLRALADDSQSTWTFGSAWVPDLVWISLAGNDYDEGSPPQGAPVRATFKAKYHELVTLVRQKNPNAFIVCTFSASLNDDYPVGFNAFTNVKGVLEEVVNERHMAPFNDAKVHYFEQPRADNSGANNGPDLTGCEAHPNAAFHQKLGTAAAAKIKTITGW